MVGFGHLFRGLIPIATTPVAKYFGYWSHSGGGGCHGSRFGGARSLGLVECLE
jgi:hypothetical protein